MVRRLLLFTVLCAVSWEGEGQNIDFEHLNSENGLSQNSVMQITQDSRGFMWFGTLDGLDRYDGHRFKVYKNDPASPNSLSANYITSLLADSRGGLWVGTLGGLDRYDPGKDVFYHIMKRDKSVPHGIPYYFNCIFEDKRGNIWVGTSYGLALIPAGQQKAARRIGEDNIRAIYEDHNGNIWLGTTGGLIRMTWKNGTYTHEVFRHDNEQPGSLSNSYVTSINEDTGHHLWIGTRTGGLNLFDEQTRTFTLFSHSPSNPSGLIDDNIRQITPDRKGRLWIGTLEGLSILDPANRSFLNCQQDPGNKKSLSQNSVYSIFQDKSGSMWVGTYFGGINVNYAYATAFSVYQSNRTPAGLNNNVISGITEDPRHRLWMGTEGGGVNVFDRGKGVVTVYKHTPNDPGSLGSSLVKIVYRDRSGNMWVGTHGGGLNLFDSVRRQFIHFLYDPKNNVGLNSEIIALLEDTGGMLWIGDQSGLEFIHKTPRGFELFQPFLLPPDLGPGHSITNVMEDASRKIWIATGNGLYRFDPDTRKFVFMNIGESINCLKEDAKGRIWMGTRANGLGLYDPKTGKRTTYSEKDGLSNNNIIGILEDSSSNLWLSTDNGLSRFDTHEKTFRNYTQSDGLAANEFNYNSYYKGGDGEMFFGGYSGVTAFYPDRIEANTSAGPMVFTSLSLFNKEVSDLTYTKAVTLHYKQNVFSISFALLNYIKPEKNTYAYMLTGFDKDWHYTGVPSVDYMNLPPGNYTFLVKGANNDGVWSAPISMEITVLPPWWATWWAFALYIVFFGALVFLVTRFFFIRALLRRDEALHQAKLNFFTNISHEIRTRLTLITAPIEQMGLLAEQTGASADKGDPLHRQIARVKSNADRLLRLVEELMDFRKAETHHLELRVTRQNLVSFAFEVYSSFSDLALGRHIRMDFMSTADSILAWFDQEQMEKVIYNLMSNALKFTPEGGYVSLTIEPHKESVDIKVTDNGKGIAPENLSKLFNNFFQVNDHGLQNTGYGIGLALSKSIMQLHKGSLTVASEVAPPESRTCFTATLLLGNRHFHKNQLQFQPETEMQLPGKRAVIPLPGHEVRRPDAPGPDAPGPEAPGFAGAGKTLLLVEDNAEVRIFISQSLSGQYKVLGCPDGNAGWETAISEIPDLVISDVMMPGMDGLTLCRKLKEDERTNHIPVILLTAKATTDNQISGLQVGADIYLTKPFSIQVLELHIRNLLNATETMRRKFSGEFSLKSGAGRGAAAGADGGAVHAGDAKPDAAASAFLQRLTGIIEENLENSDFDVPLLCTKVAMSQSVLYKKVKAMTDMSLADLIKQVRFRKAAQLLEQKQLSVYEVAFLVGFNDSKYFSKEFKKQFGKTPSEYAREPR